MIFLNKKIKTKKFYFYSHEFYNFKRHYKNYHLLYFLSTP
jgi:hypothetical protein